MPLKTPSWWSEGGWPAVALSPIAALYGGAVKARFARTLPYRSTIPVICVGNFTMGGAGKTPLAIAIAELLIARGERPAFLTRGYGGRETGPVWVDVSRHTAGDVGDEPLLLALRAPVMVSRDRPGGARRIEATAATLIIMDDGFQNPSLHKDVCVIAVDAGFGVGNGRVFPAGPLRAPIAFQLPRADAVVTIGTPRVPFHKLDGATVALHAEIHPIEADWLKSARVVAFCGIGRPEKFFDTLRQSGADIVETVSFRDHHDFTEGDAARLLSLATESGAQLVTTEKDWVRLAALPDSSRGELRRSCRALRIQLFFTQSDQARFLDLITAHLGRA